MAPDRVWSFAEPCVEPPPPTNPNAILSAIATALIRLVGMLVSPPWCGRGVCLRTFDIAATNGGKPNTHDSRKRRSDDRLARSTIARPLAATRIFVPSSTHPSLPANRVAGYRGLRNGGPTPATRSAVVGLLVAGSDQY